MASSHSASGEQPVNCSIRSVNGSLHGNWDGGLRSFFKMKAGHQDEAPRIERDGIHVGDPFRIKSLGRRHTRLFGVVKFVGVVHYAKGIWLGVELEQAYGKNDGIIKGTRYFEAQPMHGVMVKVEDIELVAQHAPTQQREGLLEDITCRFGSITMNA